MKFSEVEIGEHFVYKGFVFKKRSKFVGFSQKFGELFIKKDEDVEIYAGEF